MVSQIENLKGLVQRNVGTSWAGHKIIQFYFYWKKTIKNTNCEIYTPQITRCHFPGMGMFTCLSVFASVLCCFALWLRRTVCRWILGGHLILELQILGINPLSVCYLEWLWYQHLPIVTIYIILFLFFLEFWGFVFHIFMNYLIVSCIEVWSYSPPLHSFSQIQPPFHIHCSSVCLAHWIQTVLPIYLCMCGHRLGIWATYQGPHYQGELIFPLLVTIIY